jgi:hypothetical protein
LPIGVTMRTARRSDFEYFEALSSATCTHCGKSICLSGTFGTFGEQEPEGLLTNGAAYCLDCMERTVKTIEASARSKRE